MDQDLYDTLVPFLNFCHCTDIHHLGIYNRRYMRRLDQSIIYGIDPADGQRKPKVSSHAWARGIDIQYLVLSDGSIMTGHELAIRARNFNSRWTVVEEGHIHINVPYPVFKFPS